MFLQLKLEAIDETTSRQCGVFYFVVPMVQDELYLYHVEILDFQ
ncbi:MAG: hypothetical protein ABI760_11980 [Ferruginibacter sp.]